MKKNCFTIKDSANMFLLALIVPNIVAFFVVIIFAGIMGTENFLNSKIYFVISVLLNQIVFLGVYLVYSKITKSHFKLTKITNKINLKQILKLILIALICFLMITPLMNVFDAFLTSVGVEASSLNIEITSFKKFIFLFLSLGVFAPIMEEIIFRGVIFNGLTQKNKVFAVLISALLFMLMHLNLHQSIYQFLMGIVLACAVLTTNSLISSILIHFINNAIILIINYIMPNFQPNYLGSTYIIISVVLFVLGITLLYFCFVWLNKDKVKAQEIVNDNLEFKQNNCELEKNLQVENLNNSYKEANFENLENSQDLEVTCEKTENLENLKTKNLQQQNLSKQNSLYFYFALTIGVIAWVVSIVSAF